MKTLRNGVVAPHILNLGTKLRWAVRFTLGPRSPMGKKPRYTSDMWLCGPQIRSGYGDGDMRSLPFRYGNGTRVVQPIVWSLYWLGNPGSWKYSEGWN